MEIDPDNKIHCVTRLRDIGAATGRAAVAALKQVLEELLEGYRSCSYHRKSSEMKASNSYWHVPIKFKLPHED